MSAELYSARWHPAFTHSARFALIVAGGLVVSACFPVLKPVQPNVSMRVTDTRGTGVSGAQFTLATFKGPFASPASTMLATYRTDASGSLEVPRKRKWVWQVMLPDGVTSYSWAYCLEKEGFKAVAEGQPQFDEPITIVLEDASSESACVWPSADEPYWHVRTSDVE